MAKCHTCNLNFASNEVLKDHQSFSHNICKFCRQKFPRQSALVHHLLIFHRPHGEVRYQCQTCRQSFGGSQSKYMRHQVLIHYRNGGQQRREFIWWPVVPEWLKIEPDAANTADTDSAPSSDEESDHPWIRDHHLYIICLCRLDSLLGWTNYSTHINLSLVITVFYHI